MILKSLTAILALCSVFYAGFICGYSANSDDQARLTFAKADCVDMKSSWFAMDSSNRFVLSPVERGGDCSSIFENAQLISLTTPGKGD